MSTTTARRHDVDYKKLPISKLKSLLSAGGVIIPHVKDQPKEYYIKLYEEHILKEFTPEYDEESEDQSESESYSAEDIEATQTQVQSQYAPSQPTTQTPVSTTSPSTINTTARVDVKGSPRSSPSRSRVFLYLIPLLLAVLVSVSMTCTAQGPHAHHSACHAVQRLVHVLSLGLYGHYSGAADY